MTAVRATDTPRASFPVRRLGADYEEFDRWFYDGQPVATLFAMTGSLLFPDGEMFFVRAVRRAKDQVEDPQLLADVRAFTGQEASHAGEHRRVNKVVERRFGIDAEGSARLMNRVLEQVEAHGGTWLPLAATAALEHFTGIIAAALLEDDRYADAVTSPAIRSLIMWHAVEESEHRAVAFDVFTAAGGTYPVRVGAMALTTPLALAVYGHTFLSLLRHEGHLTDARSWLHFARGAVRRRGLARTVARRYVSYYRPGFHPSDEDTGPDERRWRTKLALA